MTHAASSSPVTPVRTLLIANRGEIACRIMRTARRMGIRTVAVYSAADANALHVKSADSAVCIGPAAASDSYLNIDAVVAAATTAGADAVHPGYGFLSENPEFVDACTAAGLVFVGPDSSAMRAMGLKDAAKQLMQKAGVPVVPGYHGDSQEPDLLAAEADKAGYPVLIKARAGGGGKGMRRVDAAGDFHAALAAAQREAAASFGDDAVLIEKYIAMPRHIEVQVFGDRQGNVVHLYERDCSLQRRHQKVIEEAPAPGMSTAMRNAMTDAAIKTAQSIDYVGAGTVEFIVDGSGPLRADGFWFMEMNTRLQVEHPVTEMITGYDLVEWQLRVAAGEPLPAAQSDIKATGHAFEARLYAEDAEAGFLPATGTLTRLRLAPEGRVDSGVLEGDQVLPYYDPMLAKLIAHADSREQALQQLGAMLDTSVILGTITNRALLAALCAHPEVRAAKLDTGLIERERASLLATNDGFELEALAALAVAVLPSESQTTSESRASGARTASAFQTLVCWQNWGQSQRRVVLLIDAEPCVFQLAQTSADAWQIRSADRQVSLRLESLAALPAGSRVDFGHGLVAAEVVIRPQRVHVRLGGQQRSIELPVHGGTDAAAAGELALQSPMPGRIVAVHCQAGDKVVKGDVLVTLEAMKMEHSVVASADQLVDDVFVAAEDQVEQGAELLRFHGDD